MLRELNVRSSRVTGEVPTSSKETKNLGYRGSYQLLILLTCQKMNYECLLVKNGLKFGQALQCHELPHSDAVLRGYFPAEVIAAFLHHGGEVEQICSCQHLRHP